MSELLTSLNTEQKEAVMATEGPLLIIAGAGAGKTKTITHRIAYLIEKGAPAKHILGITFTNKAAGEMRERIEKLASSKNTPVLLTFHAFGVQILRKYGSIGGIKPSFTILDSADSKKLVREAIVEAGFDPKAWNPGAILKKISHLKNLGLTPLEAEGGDAFLDITRDVWERYEKTKKEVGGLDFDDLLALPVRLLASNTDLRDRLSKHFKYIHIDEYQDTNALQYKLARLLTSTHDNICVVGDADQTIYTWRGADVGNILRFQKDFKNAKVVNLEKNYRSTKTILEAANEVIRHNTMRLEKRLVAQKGKGQKINVFTAWNENDEARTVVETAQKLHQEGVSYSEIGILYRTNFQSRALEEAFLRAKVPYTLLGTRFFERKEVKDMLSYLRYLVNDESKLDLARIINQPKRGIGKKSLEHILAGNREALKGKAADGFKSFERLIAGLRKTLKKKTLQETLQEIFVESRLKEGLLKEEDGAERVLNVEELIALSRQYSEKSAEEGALELLESAALMSDQDNLKKNSDGVRLLTVHASKGLEFDAVIIVGLEEGLFPLEKDGAQIEEKEEERRLMYVAVTRARTHLVLSRALERSVFGSKTLRSPSPFLLDIPEHLLEESEELGSARKSGLLDDFMDEIKW